MRPLRRVWQVIKACARAQASRARGRSPRRPRRARASLAARWLLAEFVEDALEDARPGRLHVGPDLVLKVIPVENHNRGL